MNRPKLYIFLLIVFTLLVVALSRFESLIDRKAIDDYITYYFTDYKKSLQELGQLYAVQIVYTIGGNFIRKESQLPPRNGKAIQIENFEIARFSKLLPLVLQQYPAGLLGKNIRAIKLSKNLEFFGVIYGATNTVDVIYLSSDGRNNGYTDSYIKQGFHHEFSSILIRNYNFPVQQWMDANTPDFRYLVALDKVLESTDKDLNLKGEEQYYQNGVIAKYSYTNYENDFNLFAQMVFNEPDRLKELVNKYPIIKKKYLIVKEFYLSISPFFADTFSKIL